jgi:hypothetical protein
MSVSGLAWGSEPTWELAWVRPWAWGLVSAQTLELASASAHRWESVWEWAKGSAWA